MQLISVFDWFTRTAPDQIPWALHYYEVDDEIAHNIEDWTITPTLDIQEIVDDLSHL